MNACGILVFAVGLMLGILSGCGDTSPGTASNIKSTVTEPHFKQPETYSELIMLSDSDLAKVDIALMNLLCAQGLPSSKPLEIETTLRTLDQWARLAQESERRYFPQYQQNPSRYDHSLAKFKAVNLALTLKEDLRCGYNMGLVDSSVMTDIRSTRFFQDSSDLFLHGFMGEARAGSCASLPILMVAVGRRCGYPLYPVSCKGHLYCRWDDGKERFNIEIAIQGVDSKPDSHYMAWPHRTNEAEATVEGYFKNLTPVQVLAVFSQTRAFCLLENGRYAESAAAYEVTFRGFPESRLNAQYLDNLKQRM